MEGGRLREYGEGADDGGDCENPEEKSVQDHGDKTPVLILLKKFRLWFRLDTSAYIIIIRTIKRNLLCNLSYFWLLIDF